MISEKEFNQLLVLGINLGIKNGLNLGFLSFSLKLISSFWNVSIPPTPDPHITPILDKSIFSRFSSELFIASLQRISILIRHTVVI